MPATRPLTPRPSTSERLARQLAELRQRQGQAEQAGQELGLVVAQLRARLGER